MLSELSDRFPGLRRKLLEPFVRDVEPDVVSVAAFIVAVVAGACFALNLAVVGGVLAVVNGVLDVLDGEIARRFDRASPRGNFVDHLLDRASDVVILAGVALHPGVPFPLGVAALVAVVLVSYTGTQYEAVTGIRLYAGFLGRSDRLVVLFLMGVGDVFVSWAVLAGAAFLLWGSLFTFGERVWAAWQWFEA